MRYAELLRLFIYSLECTAEMVFRGVSSKISPDIVFNKGFEPWGSNVDFERYLNANIPDSTFISTTPKESVAKGFSSLFGYTYLMDKPKRYIDVNVQCQKYGVDNQYWHEQEISSIGSIESTRVKSARPTFMGLFYTGKEIPNPYYKPSQDSKAVELPSLKMMPLSE